MSHVGVNIGALTVKVVALRGDIGQARVAPHQGQPLEVLTEMLAMILTEAPELSSGSPRSAASPYPTGYRLSGESRSDRA